MNVGHLILAAALLLVLAGILRVCVWRLDVAQARYEERMKEYR